MAREKQPELGTKSPYDARYGVTVGPCRGLDLSHDPSMIADEALVDATNVRVHDGIALSRYGQSAPTSNQMSGCVQGIVDINGVGPRLVLAYDRGTTSPVPISDVDLLRIGADPVHLIVNGIEAHPIAGQTIDPGVSSGEDTMPRYAYFWWNGQVLFGGYNEVLNDYGLYRLIVDEDEESGDGSVQVVELFKLQVPGEVGSFQVSSMCSAPETMTGSQSSDPRVGPPLYFGTVAGGVVGYVDGELVRLQADGTFSSRVIVFEYNNRIYAAGRQLLKVQDGWVSGSSPVSTSWASVALPGTVTDFMFMCAMDWLGKAYLGGSELSGVLPSGRILAVDDSSGSPVVTEINDGVLVSARSFDDLAMALGGAYVAYRAVPGNQQAVVTELNPGGSVSGATIATFSESGGVPRLLGLGDSLFISAFLDNGDPDFAVPASIFRYDPISGLSLVAEIDASILSAAYDIVGV